ncbi:MAG: hypothetical protein WAO98_08355 [Alphaproteobacteria bacterium]
MTPTTRLHRLSAFTALALMALALSACADCWPCTDWDSTASSSSSGTIISPSYSKSYIQLAPLAPPPVQYEELADLENPRTTIWRPGYWRYSGGDYSWVSAEVIDRPSPTAVWSPDHWVEHTYGWGFVPGYWQ